MLYDVRESVLGPAKKVFLAFRMEHVQKELERIEKSISSNVMRHEGRQVDARVRVPTAMFVVQRWEIGLGRRCQES